MTIAEIHLHRVVLPLKRPYRLAFGPVEAFDSLLVQVLDADGNEGWGEATALPGYGEETPKGVWREAIALAPNLPGLTLGQAQQILIPRLESQPFMVTAFATALEMAGGHKLLKVADGARVPLLVPVEASDPETLEREIEVLLSAGYRTLKVKVGFHAEQDLRRVAAIQELVSNRARVRLDANQGYSYDEASLFLSDLNPQGIELLEQPCHKNDWKSAVALSKASPVPLMLDESIYGFADIDRAADLKAATYIKLKLMKMGSLDRLADGIARIKARGMIPVVGNGVAGDVGCWMEASVAATTGVETAGEMNGFLKPRQGEFEEPLTIRGGAVLLPRNFPGVNRDALLRLRQDYRPYSRSKPKACGRG